MTMRYEFDAAGWYIGPTEVPLALSTDIAPPEAGAGQRARFLGDRWAVYPTGTLSVVLTKTAFRARLSLTEQIRIDNFSVLEYAAADAQIAALTIEQRATVRTAIATYKDAQEIDLADPRTVQFIGLLGGLDLLDHAGRPAEILAS